jgi:hypothetical protein
MSHAAAAHADSGNLLADATVRAAPFANEPERVTDGVTAVPGDGWNTELTSRIETGGAIEWDLGSVRRFTHAMIAADNDDFYAVQVSNDGRAWSTVWEAPATPRPGQQLRSVHSLDAAGRFVRLEPRGGDGTYSVSELHLTSQPRGTFPPPLVQKSGSQGDASSAPFTRALALALCVAALAFFPAARRVREHLFQVGLRAIDRALLVTGAAAALLVVTASRYTAEYRHRVIDDAYISFQYAKN